MAKPTQSFPYLSTCPYNYRQTKILHLLQISSYEKQLQLHVHVYPMQNCTPSPARHLVEAAQDCMMTGLLLAVALNKAQKVAVAGFEML